MTPPREKISVSFADDRDRQVIYLIRHQVYACEFGQYPQNDAQQLRDSLDAVNLYLVAKIGATIVGFVSITPPNEVGYSIDKYFACNELPLAFDDGLFEIRLLTVPAEHRRSHIAALLMYGALRVVESRAGRTIVAIGRLEVLDMYTRAGLRSLGRRVTAGMVTYELLAGEPHELRAALKDQTRFTANLQRRSLWNLQGVPFHQPSLCYHGGAFFDAIGDEFDKLHTKEDVISADVLDAWFDPAPAVLAALRDHLPWAIKTSPPTNCDGMQRVIAQYRGVDAGNILPGAGSSDLIFLGFRHWLRPESRVLILDPMYGEYAHVLEQVVRCKVDRLRLARNSNYAVDLDELAARMRSGYDWIVLVNPNSPTGQHVPRHQLESVLAGAPKRTRIWIDETYVDYVGSDQSVEQFAVASANVIVCKSMSKCFALSGIRCGYLCSPHHLIEMLRPISPPWAVSLPAQIAACEAMRNIAYYRDRWQETATLRDDLAANLRALDWDVLPGCANFLLCHLPEYQPEARCLVDACRKWNLFVRDVKSMGTGFDARTVRIAVKDATTNQRMIEILGAVLAQLMHDAVVDAVE